MNAPLKDIPLAEEESGGLNSKKKKKGDTWRPEGPRDPFTMLDALSEEKQQEIQKALHLFSLGQGLPKTLEEARRRTYRFWNTQPVPMLGDSELSQGPIEEDTACVREEPYSLPPGFSWDLLDLRDPAVLGELCTLLKNNYMEEDDNTLRFDFSKEYLLWALQPPGWLPQWHCGVRVSTNRKLVGFIAAVPAHVCVYHTQKRMVQVNFLCVHKKLRSKRMSPVLIREITRRVHQQGLHQAVYGATVVLPTPVTTSRYWHRSLNPRKLMDVDFPGLRHNMTLQRAIKINRLPETTKTPGVRPMTREDVTGVHVLLQSYLKKFQLCHWLSEQEVEHWLMPRENVIDSYVVEKSDGQLTGVVSFYSVFSRVMNHAVHSSLKAAYGFYWASTDTGLGDLMEDALVLAKAKGCDVFTVLDVMDNRGVLEKLKFGAGERNLHYYLYNWRCPSIGPDKVGLVLPYP
ncbi:glycylpeptide N-tetradecanoyltransferase 1-like [Aplochiton taeniatus]